MKWAVLLVSLILTWLAVRLASACLPQPAGTTAVVHRKSTVLPALGAALAAAAALLSYEQVISMFALLRWEFWGGFVLASVISATLLLQLRFNAPMWSYFIPLMLVLAPQLMPQWATYWHGFMHASIVYEILERGTPPQNSLMAGEPLRYMYAHHVLIAWLMRLVPITPPQAFFLTNLLTLPLLAYLIERIARIVSSDRYVRVLAVLIALCAASPFIVGPLATIVEANFVSKLGMYVETRFVPLMKFLGINNNEIGLVCYALMLLGLVALANGTERRTAAYAAVAIAILTAGFLYPPAWVGIVACAGSCGLYFLFWGKHDLSRVARVLLAVIAVCCVLVLPSMLSITSGKAGGSALQILPSFYHFVRNCIELALLLIFPVILAWIYRKVLLQAWHRQTDVGAVLLITAFVSVAMYLVIYVPGDAEYKFVHLNVFALSIPLALALREVRARHPVTAAALLLMIVFPVATNLVHQPPAETVADVVRSEGRTLHHTDSDEDALYTWITEKTPVDAIFVDTELTIPPLARRPLLVGLDVRRDSGALKGIDHDGWMVRADYFLVDNTGVNSARMIQALSLARGLLAAEPGPLDSELPAKLGTYAGVHPVYVVARTPAVQERLAQSSRFTREYSGRHAAVFRFHSPLTDAKS